METLVVADKKMLEKHGRENVTTYVLTVMNMVSVTMVTERSTVMNMVSVTMVTERSTVMNMVRIPLLVPKS